MDEQTARLDQAYADGVSRSAVLRQGEPPHTQSEIIAGMTPVIFSAASRLNHLNNLNAAHSHMVAADAARIMDQLRRGVITNDPFPRRKVDDVFVWAGGEAEGGYEAA
jgi:hypothetical protein